MPVSSPALVRIIPRGQQAPGNVRDSANKFQGAKGPDAPRWTALGNALGGVQSQLDVLFRALQSPIGLPDPIQITDPDGNLVVSLGHTIDPDTNASYPGGYFDILYVGGDGPASAPFFSNGEMVVVGQNGQVYVLDPYANIGAWLGSQTESTQTVTGAVSAGGLIRLTVTGHGYVSGDQINVSGVGGVSAATGQWVITVVDADNFDLLGSTFSGTFTSGGTVNRFYGGGAFSTVAVAAAQLIEDIQDSGSGEARVTITGHGYASGYAVVLTGIVGVPGLTGISWPVTVIDPDTFDLDGSVFSGSYVSGGLSLNWPTAKFIARADGSLSIRNATITLTSTSGTETSSVVLSPDPAGITISAVDTVTGGARMYLNSGSMEIRELAPDGTFDLDGFVTTLATGYYTSQIPNMTSLVLSEGIVLAGYTDSSEFGPLLGLKQARGTPSSPSDTTSGDTLGGLIVWGYDSGFTSDYTAGVRAIARENFSSGHGTKLVLEATALGGGSPTTIAEIGGTYAVDVTGDTNTSGVFRQGGTAGLSVTRNMVASVATSATGVFGTPGAGQSNGQVVTGVTLTSTTFSGGIITT